MDCQEKFKNTVAAALLLLLSTPAVSVELGIEDFLDSALKRNYDIRISRENMDAASGRKQEAYGTFFPRLSASYSQNYIDRPVEMEFVMPLPGPDGGIIYETASISMGQKDTYQGQLSLNMPLFTFGAVRNAYKAASKLCDIEKMKHENLVINLASDLRRAFYRYVLAAEIKEIVEFQKEKFEDNLRTAQRLFRSGAASSLDVSRVKVQLANTRSTLIDAESGLRLARDQLFSLAGIEDEGQDISGGLTVRDFEYILEELLSEARRSRAELRILSRATELQELGRLLERAANMPKVYGHAGYIFERPYLNRDEWGDYWMAGLMVEFPFLDGLSVFGREKRTHAQLNAAIIEEEKVAEAVRLQVKNSYYSIISAVEKIAVQEENLVVARNNMEISMTRYSAGLLSNLELNQAVLDYTAARMQNALTRYEFLSALEELKTAVGKELEF